MGWNGDVLKWGYRTQCLSEIMYLSMGIFLSHGGAYLSIFVYLSIWRIIDLSIDTYMFIYSICLFIIIHIYIYIYNIY